MRFKGKVGLFAGASCDLCNTIAYQFGKEGGKVILCGSDAPGNSLDSAAQSFQKSGIGVVVVRGDLTDKAQVESLVAKGIDAFGKIDSLVISVGADPGFQQLERPFLEATKDDWISMQRSTLSTLFLCQAVLSGMIARNEGSILSIVRPDTEIPGRNWPRLQPGYHARSEAEIIGCVQRTYGAHNIRANLLIPGLIDARPRSSTNDVARSKDNSLCRLGHPEELSAVGLFLLSAEASYVSGVAVPVTGGGGL